MNNLPKVSIIIPYKEDRGWLSEAIDSVHHQTYKGKIELIESQGPYCVSKNINRGLAEATGQYVKFFAEDDMLTSICVEASVEAMQEQGCDFLHGNALNMFGNENRPYYPPIKFPTLAELRENCMTHGLTLFYSMDAVKKMVNDRGFWFDESIDCSEERDVNMWLLQHGYKIGYVNKFLGQYRRHDAQKSLGKNIDQMARAKRIKAIADRYK